jgi:hypothetical protein
MKSTWIHNRAGEIVLAKLACLLQDTYLKLTEGTTSFTITLNEPSQLYGPCKTRWSSTHKDYIHGHRLRVRWLSNQKALTRESRLRIK